MRHAVALSIAILVLAPVGQAKEPDPWAVAFDSPAQVVGNASFDGLSSAMLIFPPGASGSFSWSLADGEVWHHQVVKLRGPGAISPETPSQSSQETVSSQAGLTEFQGDAWGSLYLLAESIHVESPAVQANLVEDPGGGSLGYRLPGHGAPFGAWRRDGQDTVANGVDVWASASPTGLNVKATGVLRAEWHNATTTCTQAGPCPTATSAPGTGAPGSATAYQLEYGEIRGGAATLAGAVQGVAWIVHGESPRLTTEGSVRLPLASLEAPCSKCLDPGGKTLQLDGRVILEDLQPTSSNRLRATVDGDLAAGRLDEQAIDRKFLGAATAATAAAGVGLYFLLKFLLPALWKKNAPGEHPRRRELLELIKREPGINFRAISRTTGLASGVLHYHLDTMESQGAVVARRQAKRVHYFENHGKHDANWQTLSLLRDPLVRAVHDWIAAHGPVPRQEVLAQAEQWGWKDRMTRYRLDKLVQGGLISSNGRGHNIVFAVRVPQKITLD